jgi:hypothetical protein
MAYETIPGAGDPGLPISQAAAPGKAEQPDGQRDSVEIPLGDGMMTEDATQAVFARDLIMNNSAAVTADVVGDLSAVDSAVALANVQGSARVLESPVGALVAAGPVELEGGWAGVVVAREFTVRDGGSVVMTQREAAIAAAVFAGVLVLGSILAGLVFGRR